MNKLKTSINYKHQRFNLMYIIKIKQYNESKVKDSNRIISDCSKKKKKGPFQNYIIAKEGRGGFVLPVLTPEAKFLNVNPVFLHSFIAFKSRVSIRKKQSSNQNDRRILDNIIINQTFRKES